MSAHRARLSKVVPDYTQGNVYRLWDQDDNYPADISVEAMDANARLFTASPELLGTLEKLASWCQRVSKETADPVATRIGAKSWASKARALIANAKAQPL